MTRIKTTDARNALREVIQEKAATAAGSNAVISKAEANGVQGFIKRAEAEVRVEGGKGARVTVDQVVDRATQNAGKVWDRFNPPGRGADSAVLSQEELRQVERADPELGELSRAAYLRAGRSGPAADPATAVKAFLDTFDFTDRALRNHPTLSRVDVRPGMPDRAGVPAAVLAGFDHYVRAEQADWGSVALMKGKLGGQDVYAVYFTTDGDSSAVELYSTAGKPLCSARLQADQLMGWDAFFGRARLAPNLFNLDGAVKEEGLSEPDDRAAAGQPPYQWPGDLKLTGGSISHKNGRFSDVELPATATAEQRELATAAMELVWDRVLTYRRDGDTPFTLGATAEGTLAVGSFVRPTDGKTYLVADWKDIDDSSFTFYFQRNEVGTLKLAIEQFNN